MHGQLCELSGRVTHSPTIQEARQMVKDALAGYFAGFDKHGEQAPLL